MSETTTTARMRDDGTVVEVLADGSERPIAAPPMRPMSEAEVEAAAEAGRAALHARRPGEGEARTAGENTSPRPRSYPGGVCDPLSHSHRDAAGLGTRPRPARPAGQRLPHGDCRRSRGRTSRAGWRAEARRGKTRLRPIVRHGSGFAGTASPARSCRPWQRTETSAG